MAQIPEITALVDKSIHDAMRELAQSVWDKHGVGIRDVRFDWIVTGGLGEPRMILTNVDVSTTTIR